MILALSQGLNDVWIKRVFLVVVVVLRSLTQCHKMAAAALAITAVFIARKKKERREEMIISKTNTFIKRYRSILLLLH